MREQEGGPPTPPWHTGFLFLACKKSVVPARRCGPICRAVQTGFPHLHPLLPPPISEDTMLSIFRNFIWADGCGWRKQPLECSRVAICTALAETATWFLGCCSCQTWPHSVSQPGEGGPRGSFWPQGFSSPRPGRGPQTQDLMTALVAAL